MCRAERRRHVRPARQFTTEWLLESCSQPNMSPPAPPRHKPALGGECSLKCVNDDECWRFKMWHRKCDHYTLVTCCSVDAANQGGCLRTIWTHSSYFLLLSVSWFCFVAQKTILRRERVSTACMSLNAGSMSPTATADAAKCHSSGNPQYRVHLHNILLLRFIKI